MVQDLGLELHQEEEAAELLYSLAKQQVKKNVSLIQT